MGSVHGDGGEAVWEKSLMLVKILRAKIHRATITEADVDYVGSITIDPELTEAVGIVPGECVLVADLANAARFETYVLPGRPGSGTVRVNGAAARLVSVGEKVIIMAFAYLAAADAKDFKPGIVLVDERNRVTRKL